MKASSGISATDGPSDVEAFIHDTTRSAGSSAQPDLIETLVKNSASALQWLNDRVGVNLMDHRTQLGGHSASRTHRPAKGAVGYTVMSAIQRALQPYQTTGHIQIRLSTRAKGLVEKDGRVIGIIWCTTDGRASTSVEGTPEEGTIYAPSVILATGGFAADRAPTSLLARFRPEYLKMAATFGDFSTGDGIKIAAACTSIDPRTRDMEKVQIHPTGFVDPSCPDSRTKVLCPELMRGLGGILLNSECERFCNELGTRAYVTECMFQHHAEPATGGKTVSSLKLPIFYLVLSKDAAKAGGEHVDFYESKKLLRQYRGVDLLADFMNLPAAKLKETLQGYQHDANKGVDLFGKTIFPNVFATSLVEEIFYAGRVCPVLHYCMGGLAINKQGKVLDSNNKVIEGLHAAGEVAGGVHGDNRLAGNSLLECFVFGTIIGKNVPINGKLVE